MKNVSNASRTDFPAPKKPNPHDVSTINDGSPTPKKRNVVSTTALISRLIQTLDVPQFTGDLEELDSVTRRQCLLRALRELAGTGAIRLHGSRSIRKAIRQLQAGQQSI